MVYDIRDYGAVGDRTTMNTEAIQQAILDCAANGGGRVLVEGGTYLTAPIRLYSGVELHLEADGVILGSPNVEDYHNWDDTEGLDQTKLARGRGHALVFCCNAHHVSITGNGAIDANGGAFVDEKLTKKTFGWGEINKRKNEMTPPRVVFLACSQNILLEGISIVNGPGGWSLFIHNDDDVRVTGITVKSNLRYPNNDGIHINCSRNVRVSDCNVSVADDAIVVRANSLSLPENKICEAVTVTNCTLVSHCGGVRLGWIRDGVIRNCVFSNLTMLETRTGILMTFPWRGEARVPDEGREFMVIENILFDNIAMDRIHTHPVRLYIDNHENTHADIKRIRNIYFRGIHARGILWPSLEGRPSLRPENLEFSDCSFERINYSEEFGEYRYLGSKPEKIGEQMFAYVKNLRLQNTTFTIADDVEEVTEFTAYEDGSRLYAGLEHRKEEKPSGTQ